VVKGDRNVTVYQKRKRYFLLGRGEKKALASEVPHPQGIGVKGGEMISQGKGRWGGQHL